MSETDRMPEVVDDESGENESVAVASSSETGSDNSPPDGGIAAETMSEIDWLLRQRADNEEVQQKDLARVSLVKHRRASEEAPRTTNVESVEYIGADDGLPTARVSVIGALWSVKLGSCARYTIAGTDWMKYGDKLTKSAPVDYVEGIGGFLLDVVGVWRFELRTVFNEVINVDACIVVGCSDEFLLGVDFMRTNGATLDFDRNEVRYKDGERAVVMPFRTYDGATGARVAAVRMIGKTELVGNAVTPVELSVVAEDGERGLFYKAHWCGDVSCYELGMWVTVDDEMQMLTMNGALNRERVNQWIDELGDSTTPLDDEADVYVEDPDARALVTKLLCVYRKLSTNNDDRPPATVLYIEHHIDTGNTSPIMMKRRRQAQVEDQIVDENVTKMLQAGVIEEGDGAWGFPVVLV
ncbi:unnamed protein product [Phytophthora fragariaefolia]|uniref:Unnamed protein product n=1 Tax=Phytophthora fragariaefolia TaxID=1490495 RepID=A0A9W6YLY1_9STRA|nr:unnamed protein product [Phytophthora fragariaefolia]